jgi:hypothetical protein
MPTGPQGQRRPEDPVAAAAAVLRIATGESDEKTETDLAAATAKAKMPKTKPAESKRPHGAER